MKIWVVVLTLLSGACCPAAHATIIRIDFAGTFTAGPLTGEGYAGWFTYDTAGDRASQSARPAYFATLGYTAPITAAVSTNQAQARLRVVASRRDDRFGGEIVAWAVGWEFSAYPALLSGPPPATIVSGFAFFQPVVNPFLSSAAFSPPTLHVAAVPEPGTLVLCGIGVVLAVLRRSWGRG